MGKSVMSYICKCPDCGASYIPEIGEICKCPTHNGEDLEGVGRNCRLLDDYPTERDRQEDA
jgi:hypothetical protein